MTTKQIAGSISAPDGSSYVTLTDGAGNLGSGVNSSSDYPSGATAVTNSATGTTAATTATLPGVANKTTYISGFMITSAATAAAQAAATITGTVSGTLTLRQPTAATPAVATTSMSFFPPIPASAVNTGIAVVSAAPGSGGTINVFAWGYQL